MVNIKKARGLLGEKYSKLSDDKIQEIINQLQVLAEIAVEQALIKLKREKI